MQVVIKYWKFVVCDFFKEKNKVKTREAKLLHYFCTTAHT